MLKKGFWSLFFVLMLFFSGLQAGTVGKIVGQVTDKNTGDPLIGVNVMIEGTDLGAATDVDGSYIILNVLPGAQQMADFRPDFGER